LLIKRGVLADHIVGIMVKRSIEMIIGILGILKAGAAYLPIDPDYPEERKQYMLADSGAKILLATEERQIKPFHLHLAPAPATSLAYIIYTSGTTAYPGSDDRAWALVNLCCWHNRYFQVTARDIAAQYAGIGFDASVWEIFPYLIAGVPLHIADEEIKPDIARLAGYFEKNNITICFLPTPMCERFMALKQEKENSSLRILLTGGINLTCFIKKVPFV